MFLTKSMQLTGYGVMISFVESIDENGYSVPYPCFLQSALYEEQQRCTHTQV